jgi:excisionase family DNA binding protein
VNGFAPGSIDEGLLTPRDVAGLLKVSLRTLARLHKARAIRAIKIGRLVRYRRADVERTLARRTIEEVS